MSAPGTLIFDLDDDLPGVLSCIEDRLRWADADDERAASALHAGATAAARLAQVVRDARQCARMLVSPTGHELAPVRLTASSIRDLLGSLGTAIAHGPRRLIHHEQRRDLALLASCAAVSGQPEVAVLHELVIGHPREGVVLRAEQWRAYRFFARAVLVDPLDRFVASGDVGGRAVLHSGAVALGR